MRKITTEEFIKRGNQIHNGKYSYERTDLEHKNEKGQVIITCPIHGDFNQKPTYHLQGNGCKLCGIESIRNSKLSDTEEFIKKANKVHNNFYKYDKTQYIKNDIDVTITCPIHGDFQQTPKKHLIGHGCELCGIDKIKSSKKMNLNEFISKSNEIHSFKYDYTQTKYINAKTPIDIICKIHGIFQRTPDEHLQGCGCPYCSSSLIENEVRNILFTNKIQFEEQKKFEWLEKQRLDFYIPSLNIAIECQGIQHFKPIKYFGGEKRLIENKNRDKRKNILCKENKIKLIYYANYEYDFPYKVITDKYKLLGEIINYAKEANE